MTEIMSDTKYRVAIIIDIHAELVLVVIKHRLMCGNPTYTQNVLWYWNAGQVVLSQDERTKTELALDVKT